MKRSLFAILFLIIFPALSWAQSQTPPPQIVLTWTDNSTNEEGFNIERASNCAGPFSPLTSVGFNSVTFVDTSLPDATFFCYRVRAFNAGGTSGFSNTAGATTKATLTISKAGTGTVTSAPVGINCGTTCALLFDANSTVALTATAGAGFTFSAWSGACTGAGACNVTMDAAKGVTATFVALPAPPSAPTNLGVSP